MNSQELRQLSKQSLEKNFENRKKRLIEEHAKLVNAGDDFVNANVEKFIVNLDLKTKSMALSGEVATIYTVNADEPRPKLNFANIADDLNKWEYFFSERNNHKLTHWCQENCIYLTVKEKYQSPKKKELNGHWKLTVKIDIQKHSWVYKKWRGMFSLNSYYRFIMIDGKKELKKLAKRARKLGLKLEK
ncbi:hypothetical protein [Leuconostoc pseudomesenteroides]|uniref:hypothetical protein n=1 Tax=Leuconostoc pseudomesenteroides TaxID=33968 RepID=UPI0032E0482D